MPDKTSEQLRRERASREFAARKIDSLLVTSLPSVRYLTGFTGSNAALVMDAGGAGVLFTDPRYTVQAGQQVNCRVKIVKGRLMAAVLAHVGRRGLRRVGFEDDNLTVGAFNVLKKDFPPKASLVPAAGLVSALRMVKDDGEMALIRESVRINSLAFEQAVCSLKPGVTEAEFAAEIDYQSRRLGAEGPAFDTLVAAGARAALPHAHPGATIIDTGMLLIDMGAFRHGYASDMTRMIYLGSAPRRYRNAYRAVLDAQLAALDAIRPGVTAAAVDRAARVVLKAHGFEREFVHSSGHGLGLEIHEPPRLGRKDKTKLEAGMAITIEPGVYIEGWGGIRIEDTVLVTAGGCDILTPTSKSLREI
ncbi:MAG: Xaa-Pro peptidase family protein [Terriglobia bacterium]